VRVCWNAFGITFDKGDEVSDESRRWTFMIGARLIEGRFWWKRVFR